MTRIHKHLSMQNDYLIGKEYHENDCFLMTELQHSHQWSLPLQCAVQRPLSVS